MLIISAYLSYYRFTLFFALCWVATSFGNLEEQSGTYIKQSKRANTNHDLTHLCIHWLAG